MADDYYIDIMYPEKAYEEVGKDLGSLAGRKRFGEKFPLFYTVNAGEIPVAYPVRDIPDSVQGLFGDIGHAFSKIGHDAIHVVNTAARAAGKAVGNIPGVGKALKDVISLNPIVAIGGFAAKLLHGERIDKAFLKTAKGQIQAVREVAPYVRMVSSVVPGVGSGVAAAIAAGTALSEGKAVTTALLEAVKSSVPGGEVGQLAYKMAVNVSNGNSISDAALNTAISELPPGAQTAAHAAVNAAKGKNVREAVLQAVRNELPAQAKKALDIGLAMGVARNVQTHVIQQVSNPSILNKLAQEPLQPALKTAAPHSSAQAHGYSVASALLCYTGVTAHALAAARATLSPEEQKGFDHALRIYNAKVEKTHTSLVRGGLVLRGNWRQARATDKNAVQGRVIQGNKVIHGRFVRTS